jgi:hypothetical protein
MGLSNCAKGCIAFWVVAAVVAAIMIPVGILVIAPSMGQHALNVAIMNIPNSTVYDLPDNLHLDHTAKIFNNVTLKQSSLPFGAKLHETQMVMHVPASKPGGYFVWPATNLGYFEIPEESIKHGNNAFSFTSALTVLENTDNFVHWAFDLTFGGEPNGTTVHVVGRPKLSALGIFHMDLKMGKKLNCKYVPPTTTTAAPTSAAPTTTTTAGAVTTAKSATTTTAAPSALPLRAGVGGMGPVELNCVDEGELDDDLIEEILQNFTDDLARTTTTTAAPTTAAAREEISI